ncbi:hypothetical protein GRI44_13770 [Altererythrobacter confluentis]|uniref:Uncharacterized protein n=1 Tax=Allopontixanthobacter confluentis TaxID=1849021 RepID=A0A6L7GIQ4_9SPHN|nr:hypothetical protein [Allopontixanthobacter confluentis]MXP15817.1 hypothetical protein [Allopontixanthobacter confluentis]
MTTVKDYQNAIEREFRHWPNADFEFGRTRRHRKVVMRFNNKVGIGIFPNSGSDWRGIPNAISDVRKSLRKMGATRQKNANDN